MADRICTVDGCDRKYLARGMCRLHYDRSWQSTRRCTVEGCDKRHKGLGLCEMHYLRWKKYGTTETLRPRRQGCSVEGCERKHRINGFCVMHWGRYQRNGTVELLPRSEWRQGGPERVEDPSYNAVHHRLRADQGMASDHPCADCGGEAEHWSYDHADEDERIAPGGWAYSIAPDHYQPRCVPCHSAFDHVN